MKKWILALITCCVIIAAGVFGIQQKGTYTNITATPNYMYHFKVAELPESLAVQICGDMTSRLPKAPIILKVTALGQMDCLFKINRQKVLIQEIYKGEELLVGEEIYLTFPSWRFFFDDMTANMGFINVFKEGSDYLVFIDDIIAPLQENSGEPSICFISPYIVAPVFCYEERTNEIVEVSENSTYVEYKKVENNEFFVTSEAALSVLLELKHVMLGLYH
jgi:hypothetical protein